MKEYALKFYQFPRYDLELVSSMGTKMMKFSSSLSRDLVLEYKAILLNHDMDISRLVVYIRQVEEEIKKEVKLGDRQSKRS